MATNAQVIRDALGLLGVLAETEDQSAEQSELGLRVLNDMMEDWRANGISIGQWPQTNPADTFPAPLGALATVKAMLAVYLAPHFMATVNQVVAIQASTGYTRLIREAVKAAMVEADLTHLPMGEGFTGGWDITTG